MVKLNLHQENRCLINCKRNNLLRKINKKIKNKRNLMLRKEERREKNNEKSKDKLR